MATSQKRHEPTARHDPETWSSRLARYREKRDFAVTTEPSGANPPGAGGNRFVVQRHRARRLHYDLRLEVDGVLASWAVPKGPTLDPDVKRLAVHVEDHPVDYFDFEGVIPTGEYGGGDVIVWDWGTWTLADGDDAAGAIAAGNLHFDLDGEKLAGRFVLIRRGRPTDRQEQWLLLHKHDERAEGGWDPEAHPASVKSGLTNDEVADAPPARWTRSGRVDLTEAGSWAVPSAAEIEALLALGSSGTWSFDDHELRLTKLDKVLFPADAGRDAVTKRDLIAYYATAGAAMMPYLTARPVNLRRYPDGIDRRGSWQRAAPSSAPEWLTRWHDEKAEPGEARTHLVLDRPAAVVWAVNQASIELHAWNSQVSDPQRPTWALIGIEPGSRTTFADVLALARLHHVALDHLGLRGRPKLSGQGGIEIWVPIDARYTFDETRAWVEQLTRAIGDTVPELVSRRPAPRRGRGETVKPDGLVRLDHTRNAVDETMVAPFSVRPAPGAPVSVTLGWDELEDRDLAAGRWTITDLPDRLAEVGDPLLELVGLSQELPELRGSPAT